MVTRLSADCIASSPLPTMARSQSVVARRRKGDRKSTSPERGRASGCIVEHVVNILYVVCRTVLRRLGVGGLPEPEWMPIRSSSVGPIWYDAEVVPNDVHAG